MLTVPLRLVSEANLREHWATRARRRRQHRSVVALSLRAHARPELPAVITLTRLAPRRLDTDNLAAACKAARDGVADWLGVDDGDARIEWRCEQRSAGAGVYGLEVAWCAARDC